MDLLIAALACALVGATLLPLSRSHHWWVRMWDFPRVQIALGQAGVLALAFLLPAPLRWAVVVPTSACLVLQLWRIRPFTPLARREMRLAPPAADGSEVGLLAANVLLENDRHDLVRALIERHDPDVVLLMETDEAWVEGLRPALARYPTVLADTAIKYYGLVFATRLAVERAEVVHLTPDRTPTLVAELRTPSGRLFHFLGLHPQPPVPGVDTEERDAQVLFAARFARRDDVPLVAMGDFNDAAWSDTSQLFKHYGRYLDPRVGRGLYASFHATNPLVRCPIDQLYVTEEVAVVSFRLGERTGSDHFPIVARVRIDPDLARRLNVAPPPMTDGERAEIERRVEEYRSGLGGARGPGSG